MIMENINITYIIAGGLYLGSILNLIFRSNEYKITMYYAREKLKYNILLYIVTILYILIGPPVTLILHLFKKTTNNN